MQKDLQQLANRFLDLIVRLRRLGPGTPPPEQANISRSHLSLLEHLAAAPGSGIRALAEELALAAPTVSVAVQGLEEKGFVTRQPHPQDGRALQLFLTPEGHNLHQRIQEFRRQKFERLLVGLESQERMTLLNLLEQALDNVEGKE